jgi:type IX secretion system substrate protein
MKSKINEFQKIKSKTMSKKIYLLLLLVTGFVNAQVVNIPDANFKAKLLTSATTNNVAQTPEGINMKIDSNGDGNIQVTEALAVGKINVSISNISDLNGINAFTNLIRLVCSTNQLTNIDINLPNLKQFYCNENQLATLNVTDCPMLETLYCSNASITSLQVSGLTHLYYLDAHNNQLTSISLSNLPALLILDVNNNLLPALNLNGLTALWSLSCANNQLTTLDFTGVTSLKSIRCMSNQLTTLDFSGNPVFDDLFCGFNNLISINIKNGFQMTNTDSNWDGNPDLQFVCIDDNESAIVHDIIQFSDNPDANFNSYCSFISGGSYNTITGTMLFDGNNNGCDAGDFPNPYLKVKIDDGSTVSSTFTNTSGQYTFHTQSGNFALTPQIENPSFFTFTPATVTVNFPTVNNLTVVHNFCLTANGMHPDLEIILEANNIAPGFNTRQYLYIKNKGNQAHSGTVFYDFDGSHLSFLTSIPPANSVSTSQITWDYINLQPFETRIIGLNLYCNSPTDTPAVNLGDQLTFFATINPVTGDEFPDDNTFEANVIVSNSHDPNAKKCLEGDNVTPDNIGKYLHYNIDFENIGTENALNVVVKDTIDITKFDINSLQLIYASHPVNTKITGNVVEFIFEDINLPPSNIDPIGGHGNVLFKIRTLPNLTVGDEVSNTANIYFDYNAPVQTNNARTMFTQLAKPDFIKDSGITIAPNPTKNTIFVKAKNTIKSLQLFDIQGRILQTSIENNKETTLDISGEQDGVYFLKITTTNGSSTEKIIKE